MLTGKNVILGVTGSIAAYKIANLASALRKLHCNVDVIMTKNATEFINPVTFETLTGNKCLIDTFDRNFEYNVEHVALAKKADVFLVAPATANVIGKLAAGIADDMLTTTFLACNCKKIVAPAMNSNMYLNPVVKDNILKLKHYNIEVIEPDTGHLACGDDGIGKMPSEDILLDYIIKEIACEKDMAGMKVCVTAGPTREAIDPVRFISNNSTGKMGYAIARNAMLRGADVTLISGITALKPVPFVKMINVVSAEDMYKAVMENAPACDIVVKAAAVADYRPETVSDNKIKKTSGFNEIKLEETTDIIAALGRYKAEKNMEGNGQNNRPFLCGFSMETQNVLGNSKAKLEKKNIDMIVANNLRTDGAGFGADTNIVTIITKDDFIELDKMSKFDVAHKIFDNILSMMDN